ncbi:FAD synthase [Metamycoplasma hyosynoviae]|uniref:FAD synthase n=2 Tax=Metamycoplasma hyosynoviae TaxID=29559 RepID=UPI0023599C46|nr:riboflavin biosynthesis protein [Metamycoplasma hyosynoviae]MDC8919538.1 riboflavin biosynthesis protein [Metamycoplasma hyosynoviae]MDI3064053.1 riboflavin biosynthesis protein [Metamycoplasma hyosynoviae]
MKIYNWNLKDKLEISDPLIMCLGSFESMHIGHLKIFREAFSIKENYSSYKTAVLIFKTPVKNGTLKDKKLLQLKTRLITLSNLKFDYCFIVDFDEEVKNTEASAFIEKLVQLNTKAICCGEDFKFGFNKTGNIELLKKSFELVSVSKITKIKTHKISSSLTNQLVSDGNIEFLNSILIDKYAVIVNTINFEFSLPESLTLLRAGIYVVNCIIKNFEYHGICLISNPEFSEQDNTNKIYLYDIEYIPGKKEEFYIEFLDKIRFINNKKTNFITPEDIEAGKKFFY